MAAIRGGWPTNGSLKVSATRDLQNDKLSLLKTLLSRLASSGFGTFRNLPASAVGYSARTSIVRTATAASRAPVRWFDLAMTGKFVGSQRTALPQAIKLIDAEGRSAIYVPTTQDGKVVDSQGYVFDPEDE
jgi:hypothetical protein